ncbi:MAG TPA: VTT domain-containing protein [Pyrinomonadaceae bacterium]|nr:VTT domain-containing protein [Pyrinomonadaceae bacterium]
MRSFFRSKFVKLSSTVRQLGKLTPIALITTFLPIAGTFVLFAFGYPLGVWLRENPEIGAVGYTAGVLVVCALALLPTNVIGVIGGFAFGFDMGLVLLMIAVVGAAFVSYSIHRRIAGDKLPDVASQHPRAQAIYKALISEGFARTALVVLLIRFSILMPFALTNFILASAKVPRSTFIFGTFVGMLPRSGAVVMTGAGLSELTLNPSPNMWSIWFGIAATLLSVVVIAIISRRALDRLT